MKKNTFFILLAFYFFSLESTCFAQENLVKPDGCDYRFKKATQYFIYHDSVGKNINPEIERILKICTDTLYNPRKEYLKNIKALTFSNSKDTLTEAFNRIKDISYLHPKNADYAYALGKFYMEGKICKQDYEESFNWFNKSHLLGNQKASFVVGYFYMKGLGVKQDYEKAIHHFKKSDTEMAKHWLNFCKYFGYGIKKNKTDALISLKKLSTNISKEFSSNLKERDIKIYESEKYLDFTKINDFKFKTNEISRISFSSALFELDWSNKNILNTSTCEVSLDLHTNDIIIKILDKKVKGPFKKNDLVNLVEPTIVSSENVYTGIEQNYKITGYQISIAQKHDDYFLIIDFEGIIPALNEPIPPFRIKAKVVDIDLKEKVSPIKIYPNEFHEMLTIEVKEEELHEQNDLTISLYSNTGKFIKILSEKSSIDLSRNKKFNFNLSELLPGSYIIKTTINDTKFNNIIIKK